MSEEFRVCFSCGKSVNYNGICSACCLPYARQWCVGERSDVLERLIDAYKFARMRSTHRVLVDLLDERLPELPPETVVVAIPTVASHIRQRGYDHAQLLARRLAATRRLRLAYPLRRRAGFTQRGADRATRQLQAEAAFAAYGPLQTDVPYLIIDDVVTTGATMEHAAKALKAAGAAEVWAAAVAHQALD